MTMVGRGGGPGSGERCRKTGGSFNFPHSSWQLPRARAPTDRSDSHRYLPTTIVSPRLPGRRNPFPSIINPPPGPCIFLDSRRGNRCEIYFVSAEEAQKYRRLCPRFVRSSQRINNNRIFFIVFMCLAYRSCIPHLSEKRFLTRAPMFLSSVKCQLQSGVMPNEKRHSL